MKNEKKKAANLWRLVARPVWRVTRAALHALAGAFVVLIIGAVVFLQQRPDLDAWHTVHLDEEFTADAGVTTFEQYLALEDRLFTQLDRAVYRDGASPDTSIQRFERGSLSDPGRWPTDWNRSFVRAAPEPRAGVLLLHGLSDSPYSMRSLADGFHDAGATVLGLRIPGHGTAPSGLVRVQWEDWAAAVQVAVRHLSELVGDAPLFLVGYSNGGALSVEYVLAALADPSLRAPDGIVLMSPEIGITKLAALAAWQERIGRLLGLRKLSWNSIGVEYDPFKYQSFALNAGRQAYRLTGELQDRITGLTTSGDIERFPPTLAFQSVADATVSAPALVHGLFDRLPGGGHELVVFDLDRSAGMEPLFKSDPRAGLQAIIAETGRTYAVTLVTNEHGGSRHVVARHAAAGGQETVDTELGVSWPEGLYSLSHVALPFPPDDALYGGPEANPSPGLQLGKVVLRGERGVLVADPASLLRIRWNPFHAYLEGRATEWTGLAASAEEDAE